MDVGIRVGPLRSFTGHFCWQLALKPAAFSGCVSTPPPFHEQEQPTKQCPADQTQGTLQRMRGTLDKPPFRCILTTAPPILSSSSLSTRINLPNLLSHSSQLLNFPFSGSYKIHLRSFEPDNHGSHQGGELTSVICGVGPRNARLLIPAAASSLWSELQSRSTIHHNIIYGAGIRRHHTFLDTQFHN